MFVFGTCVAGALVGPWLCWRSLPICSSCDHQSDMGWAMLKDRGVPHTWTLPHILYEKGANILRTSHGQRTAACRKPAMWTLVSGTVVFFSLTTFFLELKLLGDGVNQLGKAPRNSKCPVRCQLPLQSRRTDSFAPLLGRTAASSWSAASALKGKEHPAILTPVRLKSCAGQAEDHNG